MRLLFRLVTLLVLTAIVVVPVGIALGQGANPTRVLPATVEKGERFNVTVTFTAPGDEFSFSSVTDFAPTGWNVKVDKTWCTPQANRTKATGNMAEIGWTIPWINGTNFTALYKVTVPCGADLGNHTFVDGFLMYYVGGCTTHIYEGINDTEVEVVRPAICFSAESINFYASLGGPNPLNQTLELWSSTNCTLNNWSLTDDADWLEAYPTSGNCTNVSVPVVLSVNSSGMSEGDHPANITIQCTEANNSPHIIPVTLHITLTGTLQGQVTFTSRGSAPCSTWIELFEVKGFEPGNFDNLRWPEDATTNDTGVFTILDIVATTYDIGIKNWTCLSEVVTNVTVTNGNTTVVPFGATREGDVNDSDKVDGFDYSLLSAAYNAKLGDGNWNPNADFNRSGKIDGFDFSLLSGSYNQRGDAYGYF